VSFVVKIPSFRLSHASPIGSIRGSEGKPVKHWATLLFISAAMAVTGCTQPAPTPATPAPAEAGKGGKRVGAALLTQTHVFYQDMIAAMKAQAEKEGLTLDLQIAEFDSRKQNDQIETLIAQGVAALMIAPVDSAAMAPAIQAAQAKNIPVFTVDIAAHGVEVTSHIASDNEKGGRLLGEYLAKLLGGKGKVAIIDHPIVASVQERTKGFVDALAAFPEIQIVQRPAGEGQRDKAMRVCQDLLQAQPDLNAIFGINDDSALGALAAVESAGLQDKIAIVGFDGTPEARDAIKSGRALKADAVQFPDRIGQHAVELVGKVLRGETVPKLAPVDVEIIDFASLNAGK
jgi:ribose transport system substrate-binding protein